MHKFRGHKNVHNLFHFRQFCLHFIGKNYVFHGLLYLQQVGRGTKISSGKDRSRRCDIRNIMIKKYQIRKNFGSGGSGKPSLIKSMSTRKDSFHVRETNITHHTPYPTHTSTRHELNFLVYCSCDHQRKFMSLTG